MDVSTTAPGLQLYSGNFLDGSVAGKEGVAYARHAALCLETQGFPDAVNQPGFPSVVVRPGRGYRHVTVFKFSAE
jgi:aldose 1-epimerase